MLHSLQTGTDLELLEKKALSIPLSALSEMEKIGEGIIIGNIPVLERVQGSNLSYNIIPSYLY